MPRSVLIDLLSSTNWSCLSDMGRFTNLVLFHFSVNHKWPASCKRLCSTTSCNSYNLGYSCRWNRFWIRWMFLPCEAGFQCPVLSLHQYPRIDSPLICLEAWSNHRCMGEGKRLLAIVWQSRRKVHHNRVGQEEMKKTRHWVEIKTPLIGNLKQEVAWTAKSPRISGRWQVHCSCMHVHKVKTRSLNKNYQHR